MLPFSVSLRPGVPIYEQVIYAVMRAVAAGQLQAGDPFPSVRQLSQELRINPNTAHKIVALLIERGVLQAQAGIGTIVAEARTAGTGARRSLLHDDVERLVVQARLAGASLPELQAAVRRHWLRLDQRAG